MQPLLDDLIKLIIGVICAGLGGELFVRGSVQLAQWARVSPGIIGVTMGALATSSPELSVSVSAALAGKPQIGLGDALGSNVVNIAMILGLALLLYGRQNLQESLLRDYPMALLAPAITELLLLDGTLSRTEGHILLGIFFLWLHVTITELKKQRSHQQELTVKPRVLPPLVFGLIGLCFLVAAGELIVSGGRGIALTLGIEEFIIGAIIVAVGTSTPEIATIVIAKLRGYEEVGLGTILGSNIFNGLFIIGIASSIHPITINLKEAIATLAYGLLAMILIFPLSGFAVDRQRGIILLVLYGFYIATIMKMQGD
jgi:cation:H+ antiporter